MDRERRHRLGGSRLCCRARNRIVVTAKDNRLFLEAVLWRVRAGLPWRDLPAEFGNPNTVFKLGAGQRF